MKHVVVTYDSQVVHNGCATFSCLVQTFKHAMERAGRMRGGGQIISIEVTTR